MNKITIFLVIVIVSLSFCLGTTRQSKAQDAKSFTGVVPFITSTDRVGFLDQNDGKIYMYDSNVSQCVFIGQIKSLGEPIQVIAASTDSSNL